MLIRFTKYNRDTDEYDIPISDWFDVDQSQVDLFKSVDFSFEEQSNLQHFIDRAKKLLELKEARSKEATKAAEKRKATEESRKRKMLAKLKAELESD